MMFSVNTSGLGHVREVWRTVLSSHITFDEILHDCFVRICTVLQAALARVDTLVSDSWESHVIEGGI